MFGNIFSMTCLHNMVSNWPKTTLDFDAHSQSFGDNDINMFCIIQPEYWGYNEC